MQPKNHTIELLKKLEEIIFGSSQKEQMALKEKANAATNDDNKVKLGNGSGRVGFVFVSNLNGLRIF